MELVSCLDECIDERAVSRDPQLKTGMEGSGLVDSSKIAPGTLWALMALVTRSRNRLVAVPTKRHQPKEGPYRCQR